MVCARRTTWRKARVHLGPWWYLVRVRARVRVGVRARVTVRVRVRVRVRARGGTS